jgi:hypothetical protein
MTESTVDTPCDSIDYTNDDEVISVSFPELFAFVSDLESELDASMDEMLDSICIATALKQQLSHSYAICLCVTM